MKKNVFLSMCLLISMSVNAQITFDSEKIISASASPLDIFMADIDNDGDSDIVYAANEANLYWFKNDGSGNFTRSDPFGHGFVAVKVFIADLNGDNNKDVIYASNASIKWYSNDGTGNFTAHDTLRLNGANGLTAIFAYDIDGDGDNDIVVTFAQYHSNKLVWYENTDGNGTFGTEITVYDRSADVNNSNFTPVDLFVTDFNNDGYGDMLVASSESPAQYFKWSLNNNDGTWDSDSLFFPGETPYCVGAADMDNDGDIDIIGGFWTNSTNDKIIWIKNRGDGTFGHDSLIVFNDAAASIRGISVADMDLDGDKDIIALDYTNGKIYVLTNENSGTFFSNSSINYSGPYKISIADIEGDKDLDITMAAIKISWLDNITPIFLQNPQDAAQVCVGTDSVLFTVKTINAAYPPRWQEDYGSGFADISTSDSHYHGVETDSLYVNAWYANMNGYKYRCKITGADPGYPKETSDFAIMTVDQPVQANAGSDENLCEASDLQLLGNNPSPNMGNWTSNATSATFNDANIYNTTTQNFGTGVIEMYWSIDNKSCGFSKDTMIIKNFQNITANAGIDTEICDTSKYELQANNPASPGIGTWRSNRAEVSFNDVNAWNAIASNLPAGISPSTTFTWEINNGACGNNSDQIVISRYETIIANAGSDRSVCNQTVGSLEANNPSPGTGQWSSSDPNVLIESPNYYATNLSNISHGSYTYSWIIENHVCGWNSDDMVLSSYNYVNVDEQPSSLTVAEGENAYFEIKVSGDVLSYQWYKDDNPLSNDSRIAGSTTNRLEINNAQVSDTGAYKCTFIDGCNADKHNSNIVQLTVTNSGTGIDELQMNGINIHPNPTNGQFQITNSGNKISEIKIINLQGAIILEKTNINSNILSVDLSTYPKGVYVLNIMKNNRYIKYELILQ